MKTFIFGLLIISVMASCSVIGTKKRDWSFIQSVGGLKTEKPIDTYDGWYLPIKINVTGLEEITTLPTTLNSALECAKIDIKKNDSIIYLTVRTGLFGLRSNDRSGKAINIGDLKTGKYFVYYKFKNKLDIIDSFNIIEDEFSQLRVK